MKIDEAQEPKPSSYRWVVMITFMAAHSTSFGALMGLGILLPAMTEELTLSPSEQGWLGSSAMIGNLVFSLPFGWWLSRYNASRMTAITLAVGAFFVFVQGWAPTFALLLVGRLIFGLTTVARHIARVMLIQQWLPQREIVLANGLFNAIYGVSLSMLFIATPFVLKFFDGNWRKTLYAFAFMNVGLALAWVLLGRENITQAYSRRVASQESTPLQSLFRYREPWLVGIGMMGFAIAFGAQTTFWPTFMKDTYSMSLVKSGFMIGIGGLTLAAGAFVVLPLVSKAASDRVPLMIIGIGMTSTFLAVLVTDAIPVLVIMFMVSGLARAGFWIIFMTIPFKLQGSKPRETAVIQSQMMTMSSIGGILGPLMVGFIDEATGDIELAMMVTMSCSILVCLTSLFLPGREREQPIGAQG